MGDGKLNQWTARTRNPRLKKNDAPDLYRPRGVTLISRKCRLIWRGLAAQLVHLRAGGFGILGVRIFIDHLLVVLARGLRLARIRHGRSHLQKLGRILGGLSGLDRFGDLRIGLDLFDFLGGLLSGIAVLVRRSDLLVRLERLGVVLLLEEFVSQLE